jgi:hypothetical protein
MQFGISEFAGAVDGNKEIELAFFRPHFGNIDMEVAERILLEFSSCPALFKLGQTEDAVVRFP